MEVRLREIYGNWDKGYALDKHTVSSTPIGTNEWGHTIWDTKRTDAGEALYQLKYKHDWGQIQPLAAQIAASIYPLLSDVGFIVPMPASKARDRQPVYEIAVELGKIVGKPVFNNILHKAPTGQALKDIGSKADRAKALEGKIVLNEAITNDGRWNVLLVDDRYDTGASLEAACAVLRTYAKVGNVYVATATW
ncbi:ComF family protein [Burkholderia pseudomallei]|uniref:ComF family protein n=1 Tax=Burkholderia pseudomallei TaxID=28450 RepID=UPI000F223423|nr:ComF family protein [Burkholderia pseudomallei]VBQ36400.1 comF family protein [Burkholderia pseudomallei]